MLCNRCLNIFQSLLSLMTVEETTDRLISILCEAAASKEPPTTYKTGFWGRAQVGKIFFVQLFITYI